MIGKIGKAVIETDPLLAVSLTGRNFGVRPSALLKVEDDRIALDFDLACASRLRLNDTERENLA